MFDCPNLAVPMSIMQHVVHVESTQNPYAIGVVGGRLARQPTNLAEAVATAQMLEQRGFNFSLGISQVNRYNLAKYGLPTYQAAFAVCPNLQAGSRILRECYDRAHDWGKAFSCYYSGNFVTGFRHGYVQKVMASIQRSQQANVPVANFGGIAVYGNATRRQVAVTHSASVVYTGGARNDSTASTGTAGSVRRTAGAANRRIAWRNDSNTSTANAVPPTVATLTASSGSGPASIDYTQDPAPAGSLPAVMAQRTQAPAAAPAAPDPAFVY